MRVLIVEDDELFLVKLRMMILEFFTNVKINQAASGQEARSKLEKKNFDLLLIDVVLEDEKASFRAASIAHQKNIPIIFMTAQRRTDLFSMALQTHPDNYLQKPFTALELKYAIDLALWHAKEKTGKADETSGSEDEFVMLRGTGKSWHKVMVRDIFLIESYGNYCKFHAGEKQYLYRIALRHFKDILKQGEFVRIHRKYVANLQYIEAVDIERSQVKVRGKYYPLSQRSRAEVNRIIHGKKKP